MGSASRFLALLSNCGGRGDGRAQGGCEQVSVKRRGPRQVLSVVEFGAFGCVWTLTVRRETVSHNFFGHLVCDCPLWVKHVPAVLPSLLLLPDDSRRFPLLSEDTKAFGIKGAAHLLNWGFLLLVTHIITRFPVCLPMQDKHHVQEINAGFAC